ncbi:MAG: hypothetical protein HND49_20625 [Planctomycetes bacterium]|nr:hypothetical protein [Planctomycetota bacterium]
MRVEKKVHRTRTYQDGIEMVKSMDLAGSFLSTCGLALAGKEQKED